MSLEERAYWDHYYRNKRGSSKDYPAPDPILFEFVPPIFEQRPHRALEIACGYGQNALWIASQGYITDAIDISRVALAVAQVRASKLALKHVNLLPKDLDDATLEKNAYDVVCVFRFVKRGLIPDLRAAVRPGGRIIYMAHNTDMLQTDPTQDPEQLLRVGELVGYFADWKILNMLNINGVSQLVAVKPEAPPR